MTKMNDHRGPVEITSAFGETVCSPGRTGQAFRLAGLMTPGNFARPKRGAPGYLSPLPHFYRHGSLAAGRSPSLAGAPAGWLAHQTGNLLWLVRRNRSHDAARQEEEPTWLIEGSALSARHATPSVQT